MDFNFGNFMSGLGSLVNEQFGFGENAVTSLDATADNGRIEQFGLLGDFSKKFDHSAERTYVEDGFIRNVRPRLRNVIFQQPDITVIIKKRMFSSLAENHRMDLLEDKEKLFVRASKRLFQNKCRLMAAYERLTKIEQVSLATGQFNTHLAPALFRAIEVLDNLKSSVDSKGLLDPKARVAFDQLRHAMAFSDTTSLTTWTALPDQAFPGELGEGTGTMELTTVASLSTKVSTSFGAGNASLTIEDPYKLLVVTTSDIENALQDASNIYKTGGFGRFTEIETRNLIDKQKIELNQLRTGRGASPIRFVVNANVIISKKVRAFTDRGVEIIFTYKPGLVGIGSSVEIDNRYRSDRSGESTIPSDLGEEVLNSDEQNVFNRIISNIFLYLGFQETTRSKAKTDNENINYARIKMREEYGGRPIIQPVDVVSIFMTTRTSEDERITLGFSNASSIGRTQSQKIGESLNNLFSSFNATLQNLSGKEGNPEEAEKRAIVGAEFPTWLWRLFRNDFTRQSAGTCIFHGLVKNGVSHRYSDGKYVLSVPCEDNSGFFNKSQINLKPALDAWNSSLYDPLTPFDVSFDAATGVPITDFNQGNFPPLLSENQELLETRFLKFKNGRYAGQQANPTLYKTNDGEIHFGSYRRILNDPEGLVYRWKQGIQSLTKTDRTVPESSVRDERSPLLTRSPYAGQDVMNVLSLTITGQPYNFNTFLRAAIENGNSIGSRDPSTNLPAAITYIEALLNDLSKRNVVWGDFVPFKKLIINEEADAFFRQGQADFLTRNNKLINLMKERAQLEDEFMFFSSEQADDPDVYPRDADGNRRPNPDVPALSAEESQLSAKIAELDIQIEKLKEDFEVSIRNNSSVRIVGDEADIETIGGNETSETTSKIEFRKKLGALTLRRLWAVKANDDRNLFIVDDQYDKNFDIMGFERKIQKNIKLFESEYTTVEQDIQNAAKILGLEIFADSQGHIQARPPQYNRVPSSVFNRMFRQRHETGIKVFPDFLENLYKNQIQGLVDKLEIIEDQIRLHVTALGVVPHDLSSPDVEIEKFINGNSAGRKFICESDFHFISDSNGKIGPKGFLTVFTQSNSDLMQSLREGPLKDLQQSVDYSRSAGRLFDVVNRDNEFQKLTFMAGLPQQTFDRAYVIRERLTKNKGITAPRILDLYSDTRQRKNLGNNFTNLDAINIMSQVTQYISERQRLIISLSNSLRNLEEGVRVNIDDTTGNAAQMPFLYRDSETSIPSMLTHMIEYEDNHELGLNSGKRFVITDDRITSITITENAPPHTLIQVNGLLGQGFVDAPGGLTTTAGGNAVTSAYAVDYDMWRRYGFRAPNSITMPMFSDPDSQCAPYAVFWLNLARKNILQGSVEINGYNEFYQAGDVVYIEDRDLLFYVEDVSHNFSYGSLSTTLSLTYGHTPGEYIPTMLDIVGKIMYNARGFSGQFRHSRFDAQDGDQSVGSIIVTPSAERSELIDGINLSELEKVLIGPRGEQNRTVLNNLLLASSRLLNPVGYREKSVKLELRYYTGGIYESKLREVANALKIYLVSPQQISGLTDQIFGSDVQNKFTISEDSVKVIGVSVDDFKYPSKSAWNVVRTLADEWKNYDSIPSVSNRLDNILRNHVIDAWIVLEDLPPAKTLREAETIDDIAELAGVETTIAEQDAAAARALAEQIAEEEG